MIGLCAHGGAVRCWPCMTGQCYERPTEHVWWDADDVDHASSTGQPLPSGLCGCAFWWRPCSCPRDRGDAVTASDGASAGDAPDPDGAWFHLRTRTTAEMAATALDCPARQSEAGEGREAAGDAHSPVQTVVEPDPGATYDGLMTVGDLIDELARVPLRSKVVLGILTPDGNNPRLLAAVVRVHDDVWKLPTVEIVGQPLPGETR